MVVLVDFGDCYLSIQEHGLWNILETGNYTTWINIYPCTESVASKNLFCAHSSVHAPHQNQSLFLDSQCVR